MLIKSKVLARGKPVLQKGSYDISRIDLEKLHESILRGRLRPRHPESRRRLDLVDPQPDGIAVGRRIENFRSRFITVVVVVSIGGLGGLGRAREEVGYHS